MALPSSGTSFSFGQINDDKIYQAEEEGKYQKYLSEILKKNDGLFFNDEMILIEKK